MTIKRLVPLLITILISQAGCANRSAQVSQEGRIYCKQNYPTIAFSTRTETAQSDFQKCLDTIDQELAKNRERLESKALEIQHANQIRLLQRKKELASPDSRLFYCRTHMQDVIDAENERARLLPARVRAYKDSSLSEAERAARVDAYNRAEAKLAELIPQRYRGEMDLPTAVSVFSRCDLKDFSE